MFSPYSKETQLSGHKKKEKNTPKFTNKRPKKKKKNPLKPEVYRGRVIPKKSVRGRITREQYNETIRQHGYECYFCGYTVDLECHHVTPKGYSRDKSGRGVWRNLRFLCNSCHTGDDGVHRNKDKMIELQQYHERLYGPHYYCDVYDLFKMGLVENTTEEAYENFFSE